MCTVGAFLASSYIRNSCLIYLWHAEQSYRSAAVGQEGLSAKTCEWNRVHLVKPKKRTLWRKRCPNSSRFADI